MKKDQKMVAIYMDMETYKRLRQRWVDDPEKLPKSFQHFMMCLIEAGEKAVYLEEV